MKPLLVLFSMRPPLLVYLCAAPFPSFNSLHDDACHPRIRRALLLFSLSIFCTSSYRTPTLGHTHSLSFAPLFGVYFTSQGTPPRFKELLFINSRPPISRQGKRKTRGCAKNEEMMNVRLALSLFSSFQ